ncbi:AAA domain-containing protein [Helicobacter saguini]|uniref:AAA domain-containing protein n=2 Tax=Helicobacter saguini TaxID=1548018 RepID=A0A347W0X2_9HELI|nr:AAA domain-containing protein [Helicobacter saguini]MWV68264.1 AAA domain-containing protein [Helicobacter saguini]MWV70272.1 AAA domain-containing protein [Helicobacter saguini]MWV72174.1 AAA domain-containing protein [Helicobacter saguini]TLD95348.1 hypothetical protein LS64_002390 [Helicobacter saguini]
MECIDNNYVWAYKDYGAQALEKQSKIGDYIVIPTANYGRSRTIRAFGILGDFIETKGIQSYRKVKWLWVDKSGGGLMLSDVNFGRPTFQRVYKNKDKILSAISNILNPNDNTDTNTDSIESKPTLKPYILIIDEINRGNISKILGELITLIEESKRIGNEEELRVSLPYSGREFDNGKGFGVPRNLYIIGTMNTADRSIALIDTALRRRFSFVEMMPDSTLLKNIWLVKHDDKNQADENYIDINDNEEAEILSKILESINNRIEFLLDREHTIGHSFFYERAIFYTDDELGEWYELSLDSLKFIFKNKIIPLLQEYFYEDYAKIDAVLNGNKMIESKSMSDLKVNLSDDFVDSEKRVYRITESSKWNIETFTDIYTKDSKKEDSKN